MSGQVLLPGYIYRFIPCYTAVVTRRHGDSRREHGQALPLLSPRHLRRINVFSVLIVSSVTMAKILSEFSRVMTHLTCSKPSRVLTSTSISSSGPITTAATLVFAVVGCFHSPPTGFTSSLAMRLATVASTSFVAKCRPGQRVLPPPNARKQTSRGRFCLSSERNRRGLKSETWGPQCRASGWMMRLGICNMAPFFSNQLSRYVSSMTSRTEVPMEL